MLEIKSYIFNIMLRCEKSLGVSTASTGEGARA